MNWTQSRLDFTTMIPQVDLFLFVSWKKLKTPKRPLVIEIFEQFFQTEYLHTFNMLLQGSTNLNTLEEL